MASYAPEVEFANVASCPFTLHSSNLFEEVLLYDLFHLCDFLRAEASLRPCRNCVSGALEGATVIKYAAAASHRHLDSIHCATGVVPQDVPIFVCPLSEDLDDAVGAAAILRKEDRGHSKMTSPGCIFASTTETVTKGNVIQQKKLTEVFIFFS